MLSEISHNKFYRFCEAPCSCQLIIGCNQEGNEFITSHAARIMDTSPDELIWIHPKGPGPHIIYNQCPKKTCKNTPQTITDFIFNYTKKKSKGSLVCCKLSQITRTNVLGCVKMGVQKQLDELFILS
jgi:hypothetical protein